MKVSITQRVPQISAQPNLIQTAWYSVEEVRSSVTWWYCNISSSSERSQCSKAVDCEIFVLLLCAADLSTVKEFNLEQCINYDEDDDDDDDWWTWIKSDKKNTHNIRPGRLLLRFFEPKSLTRENKLSLLGFSQFPMLLLGLLAHRLALAFSRSLACLFCRMRELAIAAAVASLAFCCSDASQIKNDHMLCILKSCVLRTLSLRKKNQYSMTDCVMVISEERAFFFIDKSLGLKPAQPLHSASAVVPCHGAADPGRQLLFFSPGKKAVF